WAATLRAVKHQTLLAVGLGLLLISNAPLRAADGPAATLKLVAEGFTSPSVLIPHPAAPGHLLVVDQIGTIHVLGPESQVREKLFLDLRSRLVKLNQGFDERGVLGLALHPRFRENRKFYVYYSAPRRAECPADWDHTSHLSEFKVSADDVLTADPDSERVLLRIDEPQFNHNGGRLVFGPDGFLYVGLGDGGAGNDEGVGHGPKGNAQDTKTLLGKILRLDVDSGQPYGVPKDNPFADGTQGRPEIFAYGFRNPWGLSFDRGGQREFFVSDVGQNAFEEVNIVVKGGNYGWRLREGFHGFDPKDPNKEPADAPKVGERGEPLLDPVFEYKNLRAFAKDPEAKGISITGGYVYRGKALPHLVGRYVFADWSRNWALPDGVLFTAGRTNGRWSLEPLALASAPDGRVKAYVTAFGEDADGEIYVLTSGRNSLTGKSGKVFKLVPL
ncbi:MAG TPA: PQQ-dependent sugar dehydrogenase, partial [Methylomirabilota bacterium]|nr:PQQ-dependent sugar dehydrogenase [Methylomirabilota bacterium]